MGIKMQFSQNSSQPALRFQGQYYPLNKTQTIIGSNPGCDIRIENNPRVLSMHAQVIWQGGQVFLLAIDSNAAIWVNNVLTSQKLLEDQDEIALGDGETRMQLLLNWNAIATSPRATWDYATQLPEVYTPQQSSAADVETTQQIGSRTMRQSGRHRVPGLAPQQLSGIREASPPPSALGQAPPMTPPAASAQEYGAPAAPVQAYRAAQSPVQQMAFAPAQQPASAYAPAPAQQPAPMSASSVLATNSTRYLCAAGHLDEGFQDYVMRNVIYEEHRALGESYGVDMLAVVSWCKAGLARINVRDAVLGILFLVICSIIAIRIIQDVSTAIQYLQFYGYASYSFQSFYLVLLSEGLGLPFGLLVVLFITLGIEAWIKWRWRRSHPGFVSLLILLFLLSSLIPFVFSFLITLALWSTIFGELLLRYYGEPVNRLRKGFFDPLARPAALDFNLESRLRESFNTEQRNVVAYSGYKPFAGAGYYRNGWSFTLDTSKGALDSSSPSSRLTPRSFTVSSLYNQVEQDVNALGIKDVLEIEGKLYINGQFLPENPQFFNIAALRPLTSVDPRLVGQYKERPTEDARYYQCLRFNFWRGEMIFTAFLRFIQRGKDLFTEVNYLLLPPMKDDYYWVDRKEITPTASMIWQLFKRSFDGPLKLWFGVPARLLRVSRYSAHQQKIARVARNNPAFDYGAATSLRQEASDDEYHLFFQKLDEEMYLKIVEAQILETIIQFLDAHQIDTSDLRARQQTILNNNTYVNGQTVNIGAMATGSGGQASYNPASGQPGTGAQSQQSQSPARP